MNNIKVAKYFYRAFLFESEKFLKTSMDLFGIIPGKDKR